MCHYQTDLRWVSNSLWGLNAQGDWTDLKRYDLNREKSVRLCVCSQILINKQGSGPGELKRMLVNQSRICRGPSVCVCVGWQASCSPVLFSSVLPVLHNTELLKNAVKLMLFCLPMFSLSLSLPIHLYRFHSFCTTAFYLILSPHH